MITFDEETPVVPGSRQIRVELNAQELRLANKKSMKGRTISNELFELLLQDVKFEVLVACEQKFHVSYSKFMDFFEKATIKVCDLLKLAPT